MNTVMGEVMEIIGNGLAFTREFTKDQMKVVKMMEQDGMIKISKRGKGNPTLIRLSEQGKMLYNLTK